MNKSLIQMQLQDTATFWSHISIF